MDRWYSFSVEPTALAVLTVQGVAVEEVRHLLGVAVKAANLTSHFLIMQVLL